jgi:hypothetical protein
LTSRKKLVDLKSKLNMTEINLKAFDKALDQAKESCYRIGAEHPTDPAVESTLSHLINAIEMLADAVNSHYHIKLDQDTP